jgi:hypothetical protein
MTILITSLSTGSDYWVSTSTGVATRLDTSISLASGETMLFGDKNLGYDGRLRTRVSSTGTVLEESTGTMVIGAYSAPVVLRSAKNVKADADGNYYVMGYDSTGSSSTSTVSYPVLFKFNSSHEQQWSKRWGFPVGYLDVNEKQECLAVDSQGNSYVLLGARSTSTSTYDISILLKIQLKLNGN